MKGRKRRAAGIKLKRGRKQRIIIRTPKQHVHPVVIPDQGTKHRIIIAVRDMKNIQTGYRKRRTAGKGGKERGKRSAGGCADRKKE